jgi:hypothetical protein
MVRITYQIEGEDEPRVAVFIPGLQIEGPESEVAKLGFPPIPSTCRYVTRDRSSKWADGVNMMLRRPRQPEKRKVDSSSLSLTTKSKSC